MKTINRKDKTGRNNLMHLRYFDGFCNLFLSKHYLQMNIHEKITMRSSYCGNEFPSVMIKELIAFNNSK
jgi:hypothetical protein